MTRDTIRRHWFGIEGPHDLGSVVLLMERDRIDQYRGALDWTHRHFSGVFSGITGEYQGLRMSVIYSIGPAHIADCVEFLSATFDGVKLLISTGSVGGVLASVGDFVMATACTSCDSYSLGEAAEAVIRDEVLGFVTEVRAVGTPDLTGITLTENPKLQGYSLQMGKIFTAPSVSWESRERISQLEKYGYAAVDLETGPFLSASRKVDVPAVCLHWVTDRPLDHDFYVRFETETGVLSRRVEALKHQQWLNMPRIILPIVRQLALAYIES